MEIETTGHTALAWYDLERRLTWVNQTSSRESNLPPVRWCLKNADPPSNLTRTRQLYECPNKSSQNATILLPISSRDIDRSCRNFFRLRMLFATEIGRPSHDTKPHGARALATIFFCARTIIFRFDDLTPALACKKTVGGECFFTPSPNLIGTTFLKIGRYDAS